MKNRRTRNALKRKSRNLAKKKYFLIVTNGKKTEFNYFKEFKDFSLTNVVNIKFIQSNPSSLVNETIKKRKIERDKIRNKRNIKFEFDEVWCVFDIDDFTDFDIENTNKLALKNNINLAYSNECFELWFLLHFNYYQNSMTREDLVKKLKNIYKDKFGVDYLKSSENNFDYLFNRLNTAIFNSEKLLAKFKNENIYNIISMNPSTTVHKLVKKLINNS